MKMHTARKWALLLSVCLLGAGLLIFTAGMTALSWDFLKLDITEGEMQYSTFSAQEISELSVMLSASSVSIQPSSDGQIHVQAYVTEDNNLQIETDGAALRIAEHFADASFFPMQMFRGLKSAACAMQIQLPEHFDGTVEIQSESGGLEMQDLFISGDVDGSFKNGSVILQNVAARAFALDSGNGDVKLSQMAADSLVKAESGNGFLWLEDVSSAGDIELESQNGAVTCNAVKAQTLSVSGENGNILLQNSAASRADIQNENGGIRFSDFEASVIEAQNQNGDIRGEVAGKETDYRIITASENGSSNLTNNADITRPNLLQAETENGSIAVTFINE